MRTKRLYIITANEFKDTEWEGCRRGRGLVKVGETTRGEVQDRVKEQAAQLPMSLEITKVYEAITKGGTKFNDKIVHRYLEFGLGIVRKGRVEWFEATIPEVCKAVEDIIEEKVAIKDIEKLGKKVKLKVTGKAWKVKEKDLIEKEKKKINAYEVMKKVREGYTTNREIAAALVISLNLEYAAPRTVEMRVGDIVRKLKESGIIKNKGEMFAPVLQVAQKTNYSEEELKALYSKGSTGKVVGTGVLLESIEISRYGKTLDELIEDFNTSKAALTRPIKKLLDCGKIKKINYTKRDGFNGMRVRYFAKDSEVTLKAGEYFKVLQRDQETVEVDGVIEKLRTKGKLKSIEVEKQLGIRISTMLAKHNIENVKEITINQERYLVDLTLYDKIMSNIDKSVFPYLSKEIIVDLHEYIGIGETVTKILSVAKVPMNMQRLISLIETYYHSDCYNSFYEYIRAMSSLKKVYIFTDGTISLKSAEDASEKDHLNSAMTLELSSEYLEVLADRGTNRDILIADISRETGVSRDQIIKVLSDNLKFTVFKKNTKWFVRSLASVSN